MPGDIYKVTPNERLSSSKFNRFVDDARSGTLMSSDGATLLRTSGGVTERAIVSPAKKVIPTHTSATSDVVYADVQSYSTTSGVYVGRLKGNVVTTGLPNNWTWPNTSATIAFSDADVIGTYNIPDKQFVGGTVPVARTPVGNFAIPAHRPMGVRVKYASGSSYHFYRWEDAATACCLGTLALAEGVRLSSVSYSTAPNGAPGLLMYGPAGEINLCFAFGDRPKTDSAIVITSVNFAAQTVTTKEITHLIAG